MKNDGRENGSHHDGPDEATAAVDAAGEVASAVVEPAEEPTNVLRFPKNWFGPTEELVPFGPRAKSAASPEARVVELAPSTPASADDFWSEASATVHAAVEAPAAVPPRERRVWHVRGFPRVGVSRGRASIAIGAVLGALAAAAMVVSVGTRSGEHHRVQALTASVRGLFPAAGQLRVPHPVRAVPRADVRPAHHMRPRGPSHRTQNRAVIFASRSASTVPLPAAQSEPVTTAYHSSPPAVAASSDHASSSSAQPAGPTGPVSLLGPGTTPSG